MFLSLSPSPTAVHRLTETNDAMEVKSGSKNKRKIIHLGLGGAAGSHYPIISLEGQRQKVLPQMSSPSYITISQLPEMVTKCFNFAFRCFSLNVPPRFPTQSLTSCLLMLPAESHVAVVVGESYCDSRVSVYSLRLLPLAVHCGAAEHFYTTKATVDGERRSCYDGFLPVWSFQGNFCSGLWKSDLYYRCFSQTVEQFYAIKLSTFSVLTGCHTTNKDDKYRNTNRSALQIAKVKLF